MGFNTPDFLLFLPIVFGVYWLWGWARGGRATAGQNAFLLAASYLFYGWWDSRFLVLIAASTALDYAAGLGIARSGGGVSRKVWLAASLVGNLGMLAYFKYAGWFIDSWVAAWAAAGIHMETAALDIVLPVGISFYTFQTLSYTLDVYRGRLAPERDPVAFAAFVAYFPQLVAGPIERATELLPQITRPRTFDPALARAGLRLILWGLFKKVVVADSCAPLATAAFADPSAYSGAGLALGIFCFALQIYGDFSGYSDIAVGTSRLFGIRLMTNFRTPYFARNIAEFWRRWHISLTTWFRDYVYVPLGGSRGSLGRTAFNTAAVFLISGLWHGANWTFVAWGAFHAALFLPLLVRGTNRRYAAGVVAEHRLLPSPSEAVQMALTFGLVCIGWVFFRADTLGAAGDYLTRLATFPDGMLPGAVTPALMRSVVVLVAVDWACRSGLPPRWWTARGAMPVRWAAYMWVAAQVWFNFHSPQGFIYFQF
jgi:D-alanyl-lipoteichoic acid acyltransferase DltB (MBOAT superfamily)